MAERCNTGNAKDQFTAKESLPNDMLRDDSKHGIHQIVNISVNAITLIKIQLTYVRSGQKDPIRLKIKTLTAVFCNGKLLQ